MEAIQDARKEKKIRDCGRKKVYVCIYIEQRENGKISVNTCEAAWDPKEASTGKNSK